MTKELTPIEILASNVQANAKTLTFLEGLANPVQVDHVALRCATHIVSAWQLLDDEFCSLGIEARNNLRRVVELSKKVR